jgi:PEGA domain
VNQILATEPDQRQKEQIERIRLDFSRLQQRTAEQVKSLRKQAELGSFMEVEATWEQAKLGDQLRGTPLAGEADALKKLNDQVAKEMRGLEAEGRSLIESSNDAKVMGAYDGRVKQMLGKWSLASNAKEVTMLASLLNELSGLINDRKAGDEATALDALIIERQPTAQIASLISGRSKRLKEVEAAAAKALETAQVFARQNDWEANERMLKDLLARPEWQRTVARVTAQHDLDSIATLRGQRNAWQEELRKAMLRGDTDGSLAIAKKMGLPYLPLVIHSRPSGAEVLQNGKSIGSTPLILDIPAGERAGLALRIQLTGFDSVEVLGKSAEGGWFLPVALERTSAGQQELNMTLTAKLTSFNGRLWVASRQAGAALAPGQPVQRFAFENPGTEDVVSRQPLYAGAFGTADGVWYPTREGIAIRIGNNGIERLPIAGRTDLPLVAYTSELIVGRRFIILAGIDGALHASDDRNPLAAWHGNQGSTFVLGPVLRGDRVLIARASGVIDVHLADDGKLAASHTLDGEVLSAWEAKDGLHCLTRTSHWICRGEDPPTRSPLPSEIRSAGREVLITPDNHAWVLNNASWQDVGRFEGKVTGSPIQWAGHAVIPLGKQMAVVGPKGFTVSSTSEFLAPELLGNQLAVATVGGMVRFYAP